MKIFKISYILIGIATVLLAVALWSNIAWRGGLGDQLEAIKSRGELRISTLNSPLTYFSTKRGPRGFDYELAKSFANYLGVKLVVIPHKNINDLFDALEDGNADLLAAGLIYNRDRLHRFKAGPAYYSVSQQVVYSLGTPRPKTFADMKGKLAVAAGSAHVSTLKKLQKEKYPNLRWESSNELTSKELLEKVTEGKLDYTIGDSVTVALQQRINPQLAVAFDVTEEEPVTWYLKRGHDDSLYAALLDFYSQKVEDGTLARLEEKYLGHVRSFDYVDTKTFLSAIDAVLPSFRSLFEKHAKEIDWKLLAAIAYQESHWDPQATSPTGVRGMMMLTRATADGLGVSDRLDPEESIQGGARYLQHLMEKVPASVPEDERIWFALAGYNMGWGHMLDARKLTKSQRGNPDSWVDVKQRLPMLSQKRYSRLLTYGYARGHEAYKYVENIRRYQVSLVGYLQEKEKKATLNASKHTESNKGYPAVDAKLALNF
ncbi:membrane-bound lytic murein transglycosylase MltF [Serratia sp. UGAL515B_01]|uniref:membrane-bound lytic murein transglycosylase MltF n=1 Tax=Serratia sp. UGAL515B_01 TaxID=2986763 RepID=UPI002953F898|nr:membrane-bound lytic murein transglycosylase MltF [Serratia sp. UGAL515B_01]WON75901.1 membrane-bound lytic murein transglycosylase MltF [Serratia sp. UGAL515B_01]